KALWLHARARTEGRPIAVKPAEFPDDRPIYFYDIETFGDEVFLHGAIRICAGEREERFFFADRPGDAGVPWREFLDYMARDSAALVYTWTTYENEHVEACWERFGGNERGYRTLHEGLADQCAWVKEHFVLPVRSYSIKEEAPVFGFHWQDADAGGTNCEAWYGEWLRTGEPGLREKILRYNRDDVLAMEVIDKELRALRRAE
ncbi:MAG: TM0106 family RecB-like putative nuclease, partial [bacterium]